MHGGGVILDPLSRVAFLLQYWKVGIIIYFLLIKF